MTISKPIQIWHYPKCSKSRAALGLLREHNIEPEIIDYLQTPPSPNEMEQLLQLLGCSPRELIRKKEPLYHTLHLDNPNLSDHMLITTMIEHPILIERPIVIAEGKAALGRPPENIVSILP